MKKAAKVLVIYLLGLLVCSLILKFFNISNFVNTVNDSRTTLLSPMMLLTILGGIISLKLTLSSKEFKVFLIIYASLWILRFLLIYLSDKINVVTIFNQSFHFEIIIPNYYSQVSRLATPLPFVTFWLVNHFFTKIFLQNSNKSN